MIKTNISVYTADEQREVETKLRDTGYIKISDCMWAKIYRKGALEIVVSREY